MYLRAMKKPATKPMINAITTIKIQTPVAKLHPPLLIQYIMLHKKAAIEKKNFTFKAIFFNRHAIRDHVVSFLPSHG